MESSYRRMLEIARELATLDSISRLLSWDQHTSLPVNAGPVRADQMALVARLRHQLLTSDELGDLLGELIGSPLLKELGPVAEVEVRELCREHSRQRNVPANLVHHLQERISLARGPWEEARADSRFEVFAPHLESLVALSREKAAALGFAVEPYDALLEDYERGLTIGEFQPVLRSLADDLRRLTERLLAGESRSELAVPHRNYDQRKLTDFARRVAADLGFDFQSGRLDSASHSFCSGVHPLDVRLVAGFNKDNPFDSLFAAIHEVGHGLYHQGIGIEQWNTPLGHGASVGVHESQARWWENYLARSMPFWRHFFPQLQAEFPDQLSDTSTERFYAAINIVRPSLIRVEADEVTYNLHILVRTELERALIRGDLQVADLPAAWNDATESCLGIRPQDDRTGVLQDVHWSQALFGYFPTYALGNLYAAQLHHRLRQDIPELDAQFERGEFRPALEWMRSRVHRHGSFYPPQELIRRATGEPLNAARLFADLEAKYLPLYEC